MPSLTLRVRPGNYAICRLAPDAPVPAWAASAPGFSSITRTHDELSIVCIDSAAPFEIHAERGWALLKVDGPFDFSAVGILASVLQPLAAANVSVMAVCTFDTDYILVKRDRLAATTEALRKGGFDMRAA